MREEKFIQQFLTPFVPPIRMNDIKEAISDSEGRRFVEIKSR